MYLNGNVSKDGESIKKMVVAIGGEKGNRVILDHTYSSSYEGFFLLDVGDNDDALVFVYDNSNDPIDWNKNTSYLVDDIIQPIMDNGYYYKCIRAGNSNYEEPEWIVNENILDNNVIWKPISIENPIIVGPVHSVETANIVPWSDPTNNTVYPPEEFTGSSGMSGGDATLDPGSTEYDGIDVYTEAVPFHNCMVFEFRRTKSSDSYDQVAFGNSDLTLFAYSDSVGPPLLWSNSSRWAYRRPSESENIYLCVSFRFGASPLYVYVGDTYTGSNTSAQAMDTLMNEVNGGFTSGAYDGSSIIRVEVDGAENEIRVFEDDVLKYDGGQGFYRHDEMPVTDFYGMIHFNNYSRSGYEIIHDFKIRGRRY